MSLALLLLPATSSADCPPAPVLPDAAQMRELAETAVDRGFLYRLRKGGQTSYLYGTLHIGRLAWLFPGPKLREAMAQSDNLALELDISDPATLQALSRQPPHAKAFKPGPALQKRLAAQARAACLPVAALGHLHPLLQLSNYIALASRQDGLDPSFGQELMLAGWARQRGLPIVALESVQAQLQALIPSDTQLAREQLQSGLSQLEAGSVRHSSLRLAEAWATSDLPTLARYEDWCDCVHNQQDRADLRTLNDGRNPGLAQRIASLHGQGKNVLAAVGSLHLTGPLALPLLLQRQHGFEVEQVHPAYHEAR